MTGLKDLVIVSFLPASYSELPVNTRVLMNKLLSVLLVAVVLTGVGCEAEGEPRAERAVDRGVEAVALQHEAAEPREGHPPDAELAAWRLELLDVAYEAASRMPIVVHLKNRSRAQYRVVEASLELDQFSRALEYGAGIDSWQRGAAAAVYAYSCAEAGYLDPVEDQLKVAQAAALLVTQDWQRQYIDMMTARTRLVLGEREAAERFREGHPDDLYRGSLTVTEAHLSDDEAFETVLGDLEKLVGSQLYEALLNSAEAYLGLYEKYYEDPERRARVEERLRAAYATMPGPETIDLLIRMSGVAIDHGDFESANRLLDEAQSRCDAVGWPTSTEYEYQYVSRLAQARHRAGSTEAARALLLGLVEQYDRDEQGIVNITRADALRAIAEGYSALGEKDRARAVYARALEQGFVNPNSRPRADDLIDTCVSMAVHDVEPSDALWQVIREQDARLGPPW